MLRLQSEALVSWKATPELGALRWRWCCHI